MISTEYLLYIFFFNDTATTEIYTLSLHDALPIFYGRANDNFELLKAWAGTTLAFAILQTGASNLLSRGFLLNLDRKSTRLNSSHANISYAVFCLKKKKKTYKTDSSQLIQYCHPHS